MSSSNESPISAVDLMNLGRAYWLPPYGYGNGLDALFWVCVAEIPHAAVGAALASLREQDIAGWAAPASSPRTGPADDDKMVFRLWVATLQMDSAEEVLMRVLNEQREHTVNGPSPRPHPWRIFGRNRDY